MKKSLILGIVSAALAATPLFGQGYVQLDNNNAPGGVVVYGAGVPLNGVSGALATPGDWIRSTGWTAGLYWVLGSPSITDPAGSGEPASPLQLGVGDWSNGATVPDFITTVGGDPGSFYNPNLFQVPGGAVGGTATLEVIVYNNGTWATANYRGHSAPFTITMQSFTALPPTAQVGPLFQTFQVLPVPEPSILALSGLSAAALMLVRRKK